MKEENLEEDEEFKYVEQEIEGPSWWSENWFYAMIFFFLFVSILIFAGKKIASHAEKEGFKKGAIVGIQKTINRLKDDKLYIYAGDLPAGPIVGSIFVRTTDTAPVTSFGDNSNISFCSIICDSDPHQVYPALYNFMFDENIEYYLKANGDEFKKVTKD